MSEEEREALNRHLSQFANERNNTPVDDFLGLNPAQVHQLRSDPLGEGCVLRWRDDISEVVLDEIPALRIATELLNRLSTKEIKLTAKGNLPRATVRDLFLLGLAPEDRANFNVADIKSEDDTVMVTCVKLVLGDLGLTKKRQGKLSLTAKGKKALKQPRKVLLKDLFTKTTKAFNLAFYVGWGFVDDDETHIIQENVGFALYTLLQLGKEWRPIDAYAEAFLVAFPAVLGEFSDSPYRSREEKVVADFNSRFTQRLFPWYGLLRQRGEYAVKGDNREVMATDLCRALFEVDTEARAPETDADVDTQIRSALFDAETGGSSWTAAGTDPEIQKHFHEQIRAFHSKENEVGRITVGSLMAGIETVDPDSLTDEEAAIPLVGELAQAMADRGVFFPPPAHVPPILLYRFMVTDLLAHEIPRPSPTMPAFIPFESVATDLPIPSETAWAAESLLAYLFTLDRPLPKDAFSPTMRLGDRVVPRAEALAHADRWRGKWSSIRPLSFGLGPVEPGEDGVVFQFVQVSYEATDHQGKMTLFDGPGTVQLAPSEEGWLIQGGTFEGFGF
ncbi:hypothetical protein [Neolewinella antarctica]|uniref:Uncharacterized protein n=1 Tax=Neolewinella antarctica TaxID=442734 RepID=A0ABX0XAU8_9BACT|nr:hypothetical protein [Neolewinella antarctica]NJC25953.1 hypothetical protein [Neolewinella antarctica]